VTCSDPPVVLPARLTSLSSKPITGSLNCTVKLTEGVEVGSA
jgi:hypothetical protein